MEKMENTKKTVLVIGASSELAQDTVKELLKRNFKVYTTSRQVETMDENIQNFHLDVTSELDFIHLKENINNLKFDNIICFPGIAIAGAVEELNENDIKKQLDVNLFGLHKIIKYIAPNLNNNGKLINISSIASYGVFPFLSPYAISKAAADILLNTYSIESKVKVVSVRPGPVATKFWDASIELNKATFENNAAFENSKFKKEKKFMLQGARHNALHSLNPIYVAKKIADIAEKKNPKVVYNIGLETKAVKFSRFLPQNLVNFMVRAVLKLRMSKID